MKNEKNYKKWEIVLYKGLWLFLIGGVLGCFLETLWCWYDFGMLSSRTSNLFIPLSNIWGLACILITVCLIKNKWNHPVYIFFKSVIICGVFEFLCGYILELCLGVTFWDYSGWRLHIGKYVNVVLCLAWGFISIAWLKWIYPALDKHILSKLIRIPRVVTWLIIVALVITTLITGLALLRMDERAKNKPASNVIEVQLDKFFPDKTLQMYFTKMKDVNTGEKIYQLEGHENAQNRIGKSKEELEQEEK